MKAKTTKSRVRSVERHRSFRITKKRLKQHQPLPGVLSLLKQTFSIIWRNKVLFIGLAALNALLSYIFIQGLGSSFDITELKSDFQDLLGNGVSGKIGTAAALFSYMLGSSSSSDNESAGSYQIILMILTSLAIIWLIRQILANEKPRLRDGFYKGIYPLIPFTLVLLVIGLQFVPLLAGNLMFSTVIQNGLATSGAEELIWLILFILLALLSLYMVISSVFALYIVTLPDMQPVKALRSARELVLHRRWSVALRIVALPIALLVLGAIIFIPLLIFLTPLVQPLFLLMTSLTLIVVHIYLYLLYRALI